MRVRLVRDALVRVEKGAILDVSEKEAARLAAFNNAVLVVEDPKPAKAAAKAPAKKKKA